jgi:undecaprenyl-diphosphatase
MSPSSLETWNQMAFLALNAGAQPWPCVSLAAKVLAQGAVYMVMAALVLGWVRGNRELRFALLDATLAALISLSIAVGITVLWYHPRPFEIGLGHQLISHATDASFPSDHGTLIFALAISLLAAKQTASGAGFLALAFGVAWARIYLGVHFPLDMVGAAAVAALGATITRAGRPLLHGGFYHALTAIYEGLLCVLRLPQAWFPRDL